MIKNKYIKTAIDIHGNIYNYELLPDNVVTTKKIKIKCNNHGVFKKKAYDHIARYKTGCKKCKNEKDRKNFIDKANYIHKDKYNYDSVYWGGLRSKVIISCPYHGDFKQMAQAHIINKQGCPDCAKWKRLGVDVDNFNKSVKDRFNLIHYEREYTLKIFTNNFNEKFILYCLECKDDFLVSASECLNIKSDKKFFCSTCNKSGGSRKRKKHLNSIKNVLSNEEFLKRSLLTHGDRYNYSKSHYSGLKNSVIIKCKKHGYFKQKPRDHWAGSGCQKCANWATSDKEKEWLDLVGIDIGFRNKRIYHNNKKYFVVDGIDKDKKIVYEFLGDYWHGNPEKYKREEINKRCKKTFGQLYDETFQRFDKLIKLGYEVFYIWELDYDKYDQRGYYYRN